MDDVTAYVLAGGGSSRMGRDKALVKLGGRTLLERALEPARQVAAQVRIVGPRAKFQAYAPCVEDVYPGRGPLGGIHAALLETRTDLNLMLAVDLPRMQAEFLRVLLARARASDAWVVAARTADGPEGKPRFQPLCAVYRRAFGAAAEEALRAGRNKVDALFTQVPALVLEPEEIARLGFTANIFANVNAPEDLATSSDDLAS